MRCRLTTVVLLVLGMVPSIAFAEDGQVDPLFEKARQAMEAEKGKGDAEANSAGAAPAGATQAAHGTPPLRPAYSRRAVQEQAIKDYRESVNMTREIGLSRAVLWFGAFALVGVLFLFWLRPEWESVNILRLFLITLVIIAALFIIVAGYSEEQSTQVVTLLSGIAGYLLGRSDRNGALEPPKQHNAGPQPPVAPAGGTSQPSVPPAPPSPPASATPPAAAQDAGAGNDEAQP